MRAERWAQIEELFHRAAECDSAARSALLDAACGSDLELRREVEALLSFDCRASESVMAAVNSELDFVGFPLTGETISHYRILQRSDASSVRHARPPLSNIPTFALFTSSEGTKAGHS